MVVLMFSCPIHPVTWLIRFVKWYNSMLINNEIKHLLIYVNNGVYFYSFILFKGWTVQNCAEVSDIRRS